MGVARGEVVIDARVLCVALMGFYRALMNDDPVEKCRGYWLPKCCNITTDAGFDLHRKE